MTFIFVVVEGETEEGFVKRVLAPHFKRSQATLTPIIISNKAGLTSGKHRGGLSKYSIVREHVDSLLQTPDVYVTTFFDYYGLPTDFPGFEDDALPASHVVRKRVVFLESQFADDLGDPDRFIPYFQLHEFEALLFSDVQALDQKTRALSPDTSRSLQELERIVNSFDTPEDINDDPSTAPSKRIERLYDGYRKVPFGEIVAQSIGLDLIRDKCPRFNAWLTRLERL